MIFWHIIKFYVYFLRLLINNLYLCSANIDFLLILAKGREVVEPLRLKSKSEEVAH